MSAAFDAIRQRLSARLESLGPKPRWWQRRRLKAWKAEGAKAFAEAFQAAAVEMHWMLFGQSVVVAGDQFADDSPRSQQERALRIVKGGLN